MRGNGRIQYGLQPLRRIKPYDPLTRLTDMQIGQKQEFMHCDGSTVLAQQQ